MCILQPIEDCDTLAHNTQQQHPPDRGVLAEGGSRGPHFTDHGGPVYTVTSVNRA